MEKDKVDRTKFEYKKDKKMAAFYTFLGMLVFFLLLEFNGYKIPTPPLPEQLLFRNAEMDLIPIEFESEPETVSGGSQGGAGTPSNDPVISKPNPQTQKILTDNSSKVALNSGQSTRTNSDHVTNNTATTIQKSDNPFGTGGGADHGTGSGVFGNDNGPGNGRGHGTGMGEDNGNGNGERKRMNNLNTSGLKSNQDCTIKMRLSVNSEGNVVAIEVLPGTTTNNQNLIQQITSLVKEQIKYNKRPNAAIEKINYSVNVKAT